MPDDDQDNVFYWRERYAEHFHDSPPFWLFSDPDRVALMRRAVETDTRLDPEPDGVDSAGTPPLALVHDIDAMVHP